MRFYEAVIISRENGVPIRRLNHEQWGLIINRYKDGYSGQQIVKYKDVDNIYP